MSMYTRTADVPTLGCRDPRGVVASPINQGGFVQVSTHFKSPGCTWKEGIGVGH